MNQFRVIESGVAVLVLLTFVASFGTPPKWMTGQTDTVIGVPIGASVWFCPPLLSGLELYRVWTGDGRVAALRSGLVSALILFLLLLNVTTVYQSPGLVTYQGRGTFVGPFIVLVAGCLLTGLVLCRQLSRD